MTDVSFSDFIGNERTVRALQTMASTRRLSNVLIVGKPGTGKKTLVNCTIRAYMATESDIAKGVFTIEGSLNRNKDVINHTGAKKQVLPSSMCLKDFLKARVTLSNPAIKRIVVIHDLDQMVDEAQHAMRRYMEQYSASTRFLAVAESINPLVPALVSRYVPLTLTLLSPEMSRTLIQRRAPAFSDKLCRIVSFSCNGDLRRIYNHIKLLNSAVNGMDDEEQVRTFYSIFHVPPKDVLSSILASVALREDAYARIKTDLLDRGYCANDIVHLLTTMLIFNDLPAEVTPQIRREWMDITSKLYCTHSANVDKMHLLNMFAHLYDH